MDIVNGMILPIVFTSIIIYIWMRIFHEYADIPKILIAASIANFQNYLIPILLGLFARFGIIIWNPLLIIPAILWILIIKLVFKEVSFSHAVIIGILCFATHMILESYIPYRAVISSFIS